MAESIKKTYSSIVMDGAAVSQITAHKVPLSLKRNKVAFIKRVRYLVLSGLSTDSGMDMLFFLVARSDEPALNMFLEANQKQLINRPDVVCFNYYSFKETLLGSSHSISYLDVEIPEPGFPVVNDMTVLFSGFKVNTSTDKNIVCEVYYIDKSVNERNWLMYAKRSLNAPRDLNIPRDPGGTWDGEDEENPPPP
jgi:hypothetical protein